LRVDDDGETLDPDVVRARLRTLAQFTGTDADGARFDALIASSFDPSEMMRIRAWRAAYLGRYMHQQAATFGDMPVDELWSWVHETSELLKAENPMSSKRETDL
jgi:hypothetical protein